MKAEEVRELPTVELEGQIAKIRERLFKFRFHAGNDEMQKAGEIRGLRKDIARMKTILRERQLRGDAGGSDSTAASDTTED